MPETNTKRTRTAPAILIVLAVIGLLLGLGRCGFLQPAVRPAEDYGISGLFFLLIGLTLLVAGLVWLRKRRRQL